MEQASGSGDSLRAVMAGPASDRSTESGAVNGRRDALEMSRLLIVLGVVLVSLGLLWPLLARVGIGRLPGDIVVERGNFTFYFPIVTSIVVSVVLTLVLWLLRR